MQTSSQSLTPKNQKEIVDQFTTLLADLRKPSQVKTFLQTFMTSTERSVFAKRLAIIWELEKGLSYEEIKQKLKVSSATISTVAKLRKRPDLKDALDKLKLDSLLERFLSRLYILK